MAERRMFSKKITESDAFLDMPVSSQNLYFHLSMNADDDGFVDKVKSIMRMTGNKDDDLKILYAKSFIIPFESGVIVIKHWRMNNYLRSDRHNQTSYIDEFNQLTIKENGAYTLKEDSGTPLVYQSVTENSIVENSIVENSIVENSSACTDTSVTAEKTIITLDLVGNATYDLLESDYNKLVSIYIGVDVMSELRKMQGWLFGHPQQRKTKRGIMRFITNWLSKEQDKAKPSFKQTYFKSQQQLGGTYYDKEDLDNYDDR